MAFSKLEQAMALVIGLDIAAPGFSRAAAKAAVGAIGRVAPPLGARAAAAIPAAARYSPTAFGAGVGLAALESPPGQQLLDIAAERGRMDRIRFEQALTDLTVGVQKKTKKTTSKFNKAIAAGMKTAKASTSYGAKGVLSSPKKAFSAVTKTASAINRGRKVTTKGIKGKIARSIRGILK